MVGATGPDGGALHAVNGNNFMSLLLTQKMDYWFKSGLIIEIINKGQSNDCPLSMVGATGLEPAASWSRTKRDTKLRHAPLVSMLAYYNTKIS